jgi:hypothetical protein
MATNKAKLIGPKQGQVDHTHQDNWEVMKPFVRFSFKALKVIALALISIVKALPLFKVPEDKITEMTSRGISRR